LAFVIGIKRLLTRQALLSFQLTEIPESMGELTELFFLDLYANYLKKVPHCLMKLKKLRALDLGAVCIPDYQLKDGQMYST
jgi:Leucine-rich repeat (LRR) protein